MSLNRKCINVAVNLYSVFAVIDLNAILNPERDSTRLNIYIKPNYILVLLVYILPSPHRTEYRKLIDCMLGYRYVFLTASKKGCIFFPSHKALPHG